MKNIRVLLVEDNEDDALLTINNLQENGYEPVYKRVFTQEGLKELLTKEVWDCVISDYAMPDFTGLDALGEFLKHQLEIPFILVSDTIGETLAVKAMKLGANDYIMKDHIALLGPALDRELLDAKTRRQSKEKDLLFRDNEKLLQEKNEEITAQNEELQQINNELILSVHQLKETDAKFRSITNASLDGLCLVDLNGNFIFVNPMFCIITGFSSTELLKMTTHNLNSPSLLKLFLNNNETIAGKYLETVMIRKDGSEVIIKVIGHLISIDNEPLVIGTMRDITERKQVEKALLESERFSRAMLDALSTNIAVLNEHGEVIFENKAWHEFREDNSLLPPQKQERYNYLSIWDNLPKESDDYEYAKSTAGGIRAVIRGDAQRFDIEYPFNSSTEKQWCHIRVTRFESEGPVFVTISHENITEKKNAENNLKKLNQTLEIKVNERTAELAKANENMISEMNERIKANEMFHLLVESVPNSIVLIDSKGVIKFANVQTERYFGYQINDLLGKQIEILVPEEYSERHVKLRLDYIQNPTARRMKATTVYGLRKDGSEFPLEVGLTPIKIDNEIFVLTSILDITERKHAEKSLKQARFEAEEANKRKSEFLANMSHEIRTPLNAIVGFSTILQEKTEGNKLFTEYLGNIVQSSKVLLNLINDILDLSMVEAGRMVVNHNPVNMKSLIDEILSVFAIKAYEKGITLITSISKDLPESLITDEKYLRQIFFNLIGNAVKFTQVGSIEIEVTIIPKNDDGSKIDFIIAIKDNGIGIPEGEMQNIFEPFRQVSRQRRNKYGGNGLGLSITRRLVDLLGGTISVESELGKGSVFSVTLFDIEIGALKSDDEKENGKSWLKKIRFKNPTVLMAEDVLSNEQIIKLYLQQFNISLIIVENGEDCVNLARKIRPHLILMDMQMPVMDGYTASKLIKADANLKNIPIIALTASGIGEEKERFANIVDDFLLKPVYKYDLLESLSKYLPYELEKEFEKEEKSIGNDSPVISAKEPLSVETKIELLQKYLPTVHKFQENINFDNLIAFEKDLEKFSIKHDIAKLKEYCSELRDCIETFNTENIYTVLNEIEIFIKKEEKWKL